MLLIRKFEKADLQKIAVQPQQLPEFDYNTNKDFDFTIEASGLVLGVFALLSTDTKRLCVSAFISELSGPYLRQMIKTIKFILEDGMKKTGNDIIDMTVLSGFKNGVKLAKMLGFKYNQELKKYFMGKDYQLYTWHKAVY